MRCQRLDSCRPYTAPGKPTSDKDTLGPTCPDDMDCDEVPSVQPLHKTAVMVSLESAARSPLLA